MTAGNSCVSPCVIFFLILNTDDPGGHYRQPDHPLGGQILQFTCVLRWIFCIYL